MPYIEKIRKVAELITLHLAKAVQNSNTIKYEVAQKPSAADGR